MNEHTRKMNKTIRQEMEEKMKTIRNYGLTVFALFAAFAFMMPQSASAAGTLAGTTISNEATVGYTVNSAAQPTLYSCEAVACTNTVSTDTTDFFVDRKINFIVTNVSGDPTPAFANQTAVFEYEINNLGNSWFSFDLTAGYTDTDSILDNGTGRAIYLDDGDNIFNAADTSDECD